ncbi:hypothetical protein [Methylobacterium sp. MA0201]|uniref:hypothetical protein n=1 Tax=Methylobacterium alsaeris TaxID=3344826 RepID=UPI003757A305
MEQRTTPNLPSQDLLATSAFYAPFGFTERFHSEGWLILARDRDLVLEFFPWPAVDPVTSIASCCVRVADADALHQDFRAARADLPATGIPRLTAPETKPWGLREFALVDLDGNLLRCLSPVSGTP